jgi:transcriptional regulator with XRE-family HTH domain
MTQQVGPLRAARVARNWSQAKAASELVSLAEERGVAVAAPLSLKTQLSRWENQHALPEEHYRALLCELYGSTESELGLVDAAGQPDSSDHDADALRAGLAESAALDRDAVGLLRHQLRTAHRLDYRLGTSAAQASVRAQLSHLERALLYAMQPEIRRELAWLVADAAALAGRHSLDRARPSTAWLDYETAKAAAREAESPVLLGYAMMRQSAVLVELGEHRMAVDLVEQASSAVRVDAPGPLRAWFSASRGHALAAAGESEPAHSAYRLAEKQLDDRSARIDIVYPELGFLEFDHTALLRHRGHSRLHLQEDSAAIDDLEQVLRVGGVSTREVGDTHADLAHALSSTGHSADAAEHARSARDIAARIGSLQLAARLDAVEYRAVPASPVRTC